MTDQVDIVRTLWAHAAWADALLWEALDATDSVGAWTEYAHILGADEVWLSRVQGRASAAAVWPAPDRTSVAALRAHVVREVGRYIGAVTPEELAREVRYTNSAGQTFTTPVVDILLHVALHAQYHRGKVNRALAEGGHRPAPVDYIGFVRGAPAARTTP